MELRSLAKFSIFPRVSILYLMFNEYIRSTIGAIIRAYAPVPALIGLLLFMHCNPLPQFLQPLLEYLNERIYILNVSPPDRSENITRCKYC
jgi:hypothetical protein